MKEGKPHEGNKRKAKSGISKKKKKINWKKIEIIAFRIDINHLFSFKFKVNFPQGPLIVKDYSRRFLKF